MNICTNWAPAFSITRIDARLSGSAVRGRKPILAVFLDKGINLKGPYVWQRRFVGFT